MQRVWYVAYGSNLALERFSCYLSGGRPFGGMRDYSGCRDPGPPERTAGLDVAGGLVFAGESGVWGGAMAFYDERAPGRVPCRGYLIGVDQFADVVAQEMRRSPGGEFARNLARLLPDITSGLTMGPGRYETITRLGVRDRAPMFTVTHELVASLEPAAPTAPYLRWISLGLRQAHGWDADKIAGFLIAVPGASIAWTECEIAALARPV